MNASPKLLLAALFAAAALVLVVVLGGRGAAPAEGGDDGAPAAAPAAAADREPAIATTTPRTAADGSLREEVRPPAHLGDGPHGCRGRVVDADGRPIAAAAVYLIEGHGTDILAASQLAQRGVVIPPVARAMTGDDGRFELRLRGIAPQGYELRIRSPRQADLALPNITLFEERIVDLGDLAMPRGLTIVGRVVAQGSDGFPVAGARVHLESAGVRPLVETPDGEGIEVETDAAGNYRIDDVAAGFVTISAVATGFARAEHRHVDILPDVENRIDFELSKGHVIRGVVTAAGGEPIDGAQVVATRLEPRRPTRATTRTEADGTFELIGLEEGPYAVEASASGFVRDEISPVPAGADDQRLALHPQGEALVRVRSPAGEPLSRYDLLLRSHVPATQAVGRLSTAQVEPVLPVDLDAEGVYRLRGLDPGDYEVQVDAEGYARSFSPPFRVDVGAPAPRVDVTMLVGGTLSGFVAGPDGEPLPGVRVTTAPEFLGDSPLTEAIRSMVPHRLTEATVHSDAAGRYRLQHLAPGVYRLRFRDDELCPTTLDGVVVADGAQQALPDVRLLPGTELVGTVLVDGAPAGQVKVAISSKPADAGAPTAAFHGSAVTDDRGRFTLPMSLPPGRYVAHAARQNLPNPILQLGDYQRSQQEFAVTAGQARHELHIHLRSD